jgi:hypothetical protein
MRKKARKSIITKAINWRAWFGFSIVFLIGLLLRLSGIEAHAEFLGDQGRTSIEMYRWLHGGSLPLVGPTTITGQHLGPIFYYLLAPFYLLWGFSPYAGTAAMIFYGMCAVSLVYYVVRLVYGHIPALVCMLLYAIAPAIVMQDRTLWEPNLVVLFSLCFAYFSIRQHDRISFWDNVGLGASVGVLIQLHYPNLYFLALCGLLYVGHSIRVKKWDTIFSAALGWFVGFVTVLLPFLLYEVRHGFGDIFAIATIIHQDGVGLGKRAILANALDYSGRVLGFVLPYIKLHTVIALGIFWLGFLVTRFRGWNIYWTSWAFFGIVLMARYTGVVYDHYLLFLLVPVLLAIGSVCAWANSFRLGTIILAGLVLAIAWTQVAKSDVWKAGSYDIARGQSVASTVKELAMDTPFAFTLVGSRSFSDLHYRYHFLKLGLTPRAIADPLYTTLFVLCDSLKCPHTGEVARPAFPILCFESLCKQEYPTLDLKDEFVYVGSASAKYNNKQEATIYQFSRRPLD